MAVILLNFSDKALNVYVCTGLSPDLQSMEQIRRIMRPTDVPDQGMLLYVIFTKYELFY